MHTGLRESRGTGWPHCIVPCSAHMWESLCRLVHRTPGSQWFGQNSLNCTNWRLSYPCPSDPVPCSLDHRPVFLPPFYPVPSLHPHEGVNLYLAGDEVVWCFLHFLQIHFYSTNIIHWCTGTRLAFNSQRQVTESQTPFSLPKGPTLANQ